MSKHVRMIDLNNNGIEYQCIVIQENKYNGDLYFIKVMDLDQVDLDRMRRILNRRDADRLEAWDLLDAITLNNGENALKYFHQLVLCRTASGEIMKPDARRRGARVVQRRVQPAQQPAQQQPASDYTEAAPAPVRQGKKAPKPDVE